MKVLLTGGAGYIGSHVLKLLLRRGDEVVTIDDLSTGKREAVLGGEFICADYADSQALDQIFKKHQFDAVMHFAGLTIVPESVENPLKYYQNNVSKSSYFFQFLVENQVPYVLFSSSAAVYGVVESGVASEQTPLAPISPYGRTKMMVEMILEDLAATGKIHYGALRYFNVAGADPEGEIGQSTPDATHLIKVACQSAVGKRPYFEIYGDDYPTADGTCIRDFIHVTDLAQAHLDTLDYMVRNNSSAVFNCGYGKGYSVMQIVESVKKNSGVDFEVRRVARRPGDLMELCADSTLMKELTGWTPCYYNIDKIIQTALEWEKKVK